MTLASDTFALTCSSQDKVFGAKILEVLHDDETKLCVEIICEGEGCWQRIDGGGCNGGDGKP